MYNVRYQIWNPQIHLTNFDLWEALLKGKMNQFITETHEVNLWGSYLMHMFSNLAEYIEYVAVEFSEAYNYTKYAMLYDCLVALDCDIGRSIHVDNMHHYIYGIYGWLYWKTRYISTTSNSETNTITNITVNMLSNQYHLFFHCNQCNHN